MTHPIDTIYVDGVNVSKSAVRGFVKDKTQISVGNVDDVRNADWSGQFGGLYVRSLNASFFIDTDDLQADDGINVIHDDAGNHWLRQSITVSITEQTVTAAGDVVLDATSADVILIKKTVGEATKVYLPAAADRDGRTTRIVDRKYDAATNNIKVRPNKTATITMTIASPAVVSWTGHGRVAGDPVSFSSTGSLPTGVSEDTIYYVLATDLTANSFKFSDAVGGSAINTSGSQSGIHSGHKETIMGGASYTIDSNGASIELKALADDSGWV